MADLTNKQAEVANEMTRLEQSIQAYHHNLALFGESFRWETLRDVALAGGAGLVAGLIATWTLRRPALSKSRAGNEADVRRS